MTRAAVAPERTALDLSRFREDFPILGRKVHGKPLVYLDNAATTQKPRAVIDRISRYYAEENSNVHRGVHHLSEVATDAFEKARDTVRAFLGAAEAAEIVFTRGTTEGINLVARSYAAPRLGEGDEILITAMEHHSNIVPWQLICGEKRAHLRVAPIDQRGDVILDQFEAAITDRTRLVAVTHVSNALGTVNPLKRMIEIAHARGVAVLVDGAQAVPHIAVDVRDLDADFYVFSGHKVFGPTGIGALYGKRALLEALPPYQGGGDMILSVTFEKTTYTEIPYRFEAGTPDIAGAVGLAAALEYVTGIGLDRIAAWEDDLLAYGTSRLLEVPGLRLVGTAARKASVLSFVLEGVHPHDIGTILDQEGIAVRTGHHCAQPVMKFFCVPATARASLAFYNSREDVDALVRGLGKVIEVFR
ncbi:MAG TPA: cysteine desulfurase [Thermoanaerobaculia bacterium]|nr:cysteine desulfurase [Thermoanaerobaculia bacterium]